MTWLWNVKSVLRSGGKVVVFCQQFEAGGSHVEHNNVSKRDKLLRSISARHQSTDKPNYTSFTLSCNNNLVLIDNDNLLSK